MITSRSLDDLHPVVRDLAQLHMQECKSLGIDLLIYCTYRDIEAQNSLYAKGRTEPGNIVTNAKGGYSVHQYRLAYDCIALVHGKPVWDDLILAQLVGKCGKKVGLEWAGDWKSFKEAAHFQYTAGLTITDLQKGKTIPTTLTK